MNPPTELLDDLRLLEPPAPWWLWPACAVAILGALILVWWLIRRHLARRSLRVDDGTAEQAQEDALAALERLFALIDAGQSRPYAIESSAIIRRYIELRFALAAPQRSTEEFLTEAQQSPKLSAEFQKLLGEFLACCDLLKFARTSADRPELEELHSSAVRFVKQTWLTHQPGAPP